MTLISIGDQARAFLFQLQSQRLKEALSVLTQELSSGETSDIAARLSGNTRALSEVESRLSIITQYQKNAAEMASMGAAMQDALDHMHGRSGSLAADLVSGLSGDQGLNAQILSASASAGFDDLVAGLNASVGGRFLFAGARTDHPPLVASEEILDHLQSRIVGLTNAGDIAIAVQSWFAARPGEGGFADIAYQGSLEAGGAVPVGEGSKSGYSVNALALPLRQELAGLAMGALIDRGILISDQREEQKLLKSAGEILLENDAPFVSLLGEVGLEQEKLASVKAKNEASLSTLTLLRNEFRQADPLETAAAIQVFETQLDALFAVQARMSNLKLVDYLR